MRPERSRERLLAELRREVADERVVQAIGTVDRGAFVPPDLRDRAWENGPLPIGGEQTISQPLVVAHMCALLDVRPGDRVLDVGTGSGWHAAVLAALGGRVWSIERRPELARAAAGRLRQTGHDDVEVIVADGTRGHLAAAPYDAINVAASAEEDVPQALCDQLAPGGRLVIPVSERLLLVRRHPDGRLTRSDEGPVRFVPLIGDPDEPAASA